MTDQNEIHCQMCGSTDSSVEIPPANALFIEWEYLCKSCQRKLSGETLEDNCSKTMAEFGL